VFGGNPSNALFTNMALRADACDNAMMRK